MTDIFGNYQSQTTRQLAQINSTKYPDTDKDFEANVIRLNQFVDYIAQYLQIMQKGVDQANQDSIARLKDFASDLVVILGGGELLYGIDLGDLQYFLPALGALFGFDADTPFPINLFNAVEHFFLGYVVPLDAFTSEIEDIILGWMNAAGLPQSTIDAVTDLLDAIGAITGDVGQLFTNLSGIIGTFGLDTSGLGPFADLWHAVTQLFSGQSLSQLANLTDPIFSALAPWIEVLAQYLGWIDDILKGFAGGVKNITGILNFASMFEAIDFLATGFTSALGIQQFITNIINSVGGAVNFVSTLIPGLDATKIISGQFGQNMITGLEDALAGAGTGFANIVKALVPGSAGIIDDLSVWEQNLMTGDWMRQFGAALTGIHSPSVKDIENWGKSLRRLNQGIDIKDIIGLPNFNVFNIGQISKLSTTPNLMPNAAFSVPADVSGTNWKWSGPQSYCFTVGGTGEPVGTGHASQVGSVIDTDDWNWVPVSYQAAMYPMADSIADGIEKLVAAIQSVPAGSTIAGVAVSQGAVVWSKVWEDEFVATTGRLHSRMGDVVAVVTFGNPRRKAGSHAPGTPDPGGHGIAANDLQVNVPTWWYDYANPDDIVPTVASGAGGDFASLLYDFLVNDWNGTSETLIADVIGALGNPLGTLSSLYQMVAMVAGDAWKSLTGHNPHTTYNTVKIDGTHTSVELAVTYLDSVGAANIGTQGVDFEDHTTGGSGSIYVDANGTLEAWPHPEFISVSEGQTINIGAWVMGTGIVGTGTTFQVYLDTLLNGAHVNYVYPGTSTLTGTFGWTYVSGSYVVPAGVDKVQLLVASTATATAGRFHVDDLLLTKTGLIPRSFVSELETMVQNLFGSFNIGSILQIPAIPNLDATKITSGLFNALRIPGLDVSKIISGVFGTTFIPNLDATKITSGLMDILRIPDFDAAKIISGAFNALRIPSLDASKIVTGIFGTGQIPGLDVSKIITGVFGTGFIPSLDATKITSGLLNLLQIPGLPRTKFNNTDLSDVLEDGGFENGAPGWSLPGGGIIATIADPPVGGTKVLQITTTGVIHDVYAVPQNFSVAPGDTWYAEAYVRKTTTGVVGSLGLQATVCKDGNTGTNAYPTFFDTNMASLTQNVWTKISGTLTIPAGLNNLIVRPSVRNNVPSGEIIQWDNIKCRKATQAEVITGVLGVPRIPSLPATQITSGTFLASLIPNLNASIINAGTFVASLIPNLDATKITTGLMDILRIPDFDAAKIVSGALNALRIPTLDASKIVTGIFGTGQIPGLDVSKIISGIFGTGFIPNLDATKITSGQFAQSFVTNLTSDLSARVTNTIHNLFAGSRANLVVDPKMENATIWQYSGMMNTGAAWSTADFHSGAHSVSLTGPGQWVYMIGSGYQAGVVLDVKAGDKFYFEYWIRGKATNAGGGTVSLSPRCLDSTGVAGTVDNPAMLSGATTSGVANPAGGFAWTKKSGYFQIPTGYDKLQPYISTSGSVPATDVVYVDDFVIREVTEPQNIVAQLFGGQSILGSILAGVVPNLDATKITTGTFLSSLIPNLNASIINAGTFVTSLIPNLDATKITSGLMDILRIPDFDAAKIISGAFNALRIPSLDASKIITGIFGTGQIPSLDVAKITTGVFGSGFIPTLDASKIASGLFDALRIPGLDVAKIVSGVFGTTFIPSLDATKITTGVLGTSRVPNLDAGKITTGTLATTVVPPVTRDMSPDMQLAIDMLNQAVNGGTQSGTDPESLLDSYQNIPSSNLLTPPDPVSTITEVSTGAGNFSNAELMGGGAFLNPYQVVNWNETIGATADYMVIPIVWRTSQNRYLSNLSRQVQIGTQAGGTVYNAFSLGVVTVDAGRCYIEFFAFRITGAITAIRGTTQQITATVFDTLAYGAGVMNGIAGESMSYRGVYRADFITSASGATSNNTMSITSAIGRYVVNVFAMAGTSGGYGTYTAGTLRYAVSHAAAGWSAIFGDAAGAATTTFTASSGANVAWVGASVQLIASPVNAVGDGVILASTDTTGITLGAAGTQAISKANFWGQLALTSGYQFNAANGVITVPRAGWYDVQVSLGGQNASSATAVFIRAGVLQNGSLACQDGMAARAENSKSFTGCSTHQMMYCSAGDTLQACVVIFTVSASPCAVVGEATATLTQFKVSLANRSQM